MTLASVSFLGYDCNLTACTFLCCRYGSKTVEPNGENRKKSVPKGTPTTLTARGLVPPRRLPLRRRRQSWRRPCLASDCGSTLRPFPTLTCPCLSLRGPRRTCWRPTASPSCPRGPPTTSCPPWASPTRPSKASWPTSRRRSSSIAPSRARRRSSSTRPPSSRPWAPAGSPRPRCRPRRPTRPLRPWRRPRCTRPRPPSASLPARPRGASPAVPWTWTDGHPRSQPSDSKPGNTSPGSSSNGRVAIWLAKS